MNILITIVEKEEIEKGLDKELKNLEKDKEDLNKAESEGDKSENAAYDEALSKYKMTATKVYRLKSILNNASIIKREELPYIQVGDRILIKEENGEENEVFLFNIYQSFKRVDGNLKINSITRNSELGQKLIRGSFKKGKEHTIVINNNKLVIKSV